MTATSLIRWLLGHAVHGRAAWATGAQAHRHLALNGARRASLAAVQPGVDAQGDAAKEWEPGIWARAAAGIYS
jgi:hypothetical protein